MSTKERSTFSDKVAAEGPVGKLELTKLREALARPRSTLECTPGGTVERVINTFVRENQAIRASYIENRLKSVKDHARGDFSLAIQKGRAKNDFERSR